MLADEQRRRSTNEDFYNWYVGRMSKLYSTAFDINVRFCKLAESKFDECGSSFVQPKFDQRHRGLLSGQSLMLDLQRMELSRIENVGKGGGAMMSRTTL